MEGINHSGITQCLRRLQNPRHIRFKQQLSLIYIRNWNLISHMPGEHPNHKPILEGTCVSPENISRYLSYNIYIKTIINCFGASYFPKTKLLFTVPFLNGFFLAVQLEAQCYPFSLAMTQCQGWRRSVMCWPDKELSPVTRLSWMIWFKSLKAVKFFWHWKSLGTELSLSC